MAQTGGPSIEAAAGLVCRQQVNRHDYLSGCHTQGLITHRVLPMLFVLEGSVLLYQAHALCGQNILQATGAQGHKACEPSEQQIWNFVTLRSVSCAKLCNVDGVLLLDMYHGNDPRHFICC